MTVYVYAKLLYIGGQVQAILFFPVILVSRLVELHKAFKIPQGNYVKLDALYCKALVSFVKAKVRKGQAAMVPC